jgi:hypothetical protein
MPSARRTPASGPMNSRQGSAIVDVHNVTTTNGAHDENSTHHRLEDRPIPVKAKLAAAWTSFMFLYVYVDIIGFYKPGVVEGILAGKIWEFDISQTWC